MYIGVVLQFHTLTSNPTMRSFGSKYFISTNRITQFWSFFDLGPWVWRPVSQTRKGISRSEDTWDLAGKWSHISVNVISLYLHLGPCVNSLCLKFCSQPIRSLDLWSFFAFGPYCKHTFWLALDEGQRGRVQHNRAILLTEMCKLDRRFLDHVRGTFFAQNTSNQEEAKWYV